MWLKLTHANNERKLLINMDHICNVNIVGDETRLNLPTYFDKHEEWFAVKESIEEIEHLIRDVESDM